MSGESSRPLPGVTAATRTGRLARTSSQNRTKRPRQASPIAGRTPLPRLGAALLAGALLAVAAAVWAPPSHAQGAVVTQAWLQHTLDGLTRYHRWTGSKGEQDARAYLAEQFTAFGYEPEEQPFEFADVTAPDTPTRQTANLIAVKQAEVADPDILILSAHYDTLPTTVGALDNGSGVAILLALAQSVAAAPSDTEVRFVAFSGAEQGLRGSADYVGQLPLTEKSRVIGAVNLESVGQNDATTVGLYTTDGQPTLIGNLLADSSRALLGTAFQPGVDAAGDHRWFSSVGIPAVMVGQPNSGVERHTCADNAEIVNYSLMYAVYGSVFDTVAQVMSKQTTGLAGQAHELSPGVPSYLVTDDTIFRFGQDKTRNDEAIGGAGELDRSWRDQARDWRLESYRYDARWFGLADPIPTRLIYRVQDGGRRLTEIDLAIEAAGLTEREIADLLTQRYGPPSSDHGASAWTNAYSSRTFHLDTDSSGSPSLTVTDGHLRAGTTLQRYDLSNGISRYQDDPAAQFGALEFVERVVGTNNPRVGKVDVWTDGLGFELAAATPSASLSSFTLRVDVDDLFDADGNYRNLDQSLLAVVHEYGQVLTGNDSQLDPAKRDRDSAVAAPEAFRKGSYLADFYRKFWRSLAADTGEAAFAEDPTRFVDQAAAADPAEDIAESFALFVLADRQPDGSVASEKVNFFYDYPKLVAERDRIRREFALDEPAARASLAPSAQPEAQPDARGSRLDLASLAGIASAVVALAGSGVLLARRRRSAAPVPDPAT